ncbi:MAG: tetratricopeptide repeat protein [Bacteroidales bacterium]|jgi:tetratricopeptide (TPR) repeat protein|nr:tetratricopeptide repeat protein [Bacteroidales bacterium]
MYNSVCIFGHDVAFFNHGRKYFLLLMVVICGIANESYAQRGNKGNKVTVEISDETRQQSARFANGLIAYYASDYNNAEKEFRSVIAQNPQNASAFYLLSRVQTARDDHNGALYYIGEARKRDKQNVWYTLEMATICDRMGDFKQSAKLWEEVCKIKNNNEHYLIALSNAYLNLEKYAEVIKVYDRMEKMLGTTEGIVEARKDIYLQENDVKSAVGEYEKLCKLYPYETRYYVQAATIYLTNNYPDKALPLLEKALSIDKNAPEVHLALAKYARDKGKSDDQTRSLFIAFKSPDLQVSEKIGIVRQLYVDATMHKDDKEMKNCRKLLETMLAVQPEAYDAWVMLAGIQLNRGNTAEAIVDYEKALAIDNSRYTVWEAYLSLLFQQKNYQEIANRADEVIGLFPTNAAMLYNVGQAYLKLVKPEKSLECLLQAETFAYENVLLSNIYNAKGDAYLQLDNKSEAVKAWKQAMKKGLDNPEIRGKIAAAEGNK